MRVRRCRHVVAAAAVVLSVVVTGCQKGGAADGAGAVPGAVATAGAEPAGDPTGSVEPTQEPTPLRPVVKPRPKAPSAYPEPPKQPAPGKTATGCVTEPPVPEDYDPDEFALYRIEELPAATGKVNLVVQHGAWGCGEPDTDGAPFVGSGEESRWALDQAAYVTATNPVVESTENQRIGVQELIDWVNAHPDSGLVFRYQVGDDGAIHRLDQVFMP
ncbi:hypothetical protein ACGF1Z_19480 [Streptomyces sp. NPDC048018]|uniref:hypothetical protein n=1 Tax=Streptomyces sp. NPDC048018 TaxID=3365499 RepID=UPI00371F858B